MRKKTTTKTTTRNKKATPIKKVAKKVVAKKQNKVSAKAAEKVKTKTKPIPVKEAKKVVKQAVATPQSEISGSRLVQLEKLLLSEMETILADAEKHFQLGNEEAHGDMADVCTDLSEREELIGLAEHDRLRIEEIKEALELIKSGSYGICQNPDCNQPISKKRLLAKPTAKYCLECREKIDKGLLHLE